jgi:signal transduction histidine kinase
MKHEKTAKPLRRKNDSRITAGSTWIKDYLLLFFAMAAFNGFHMTIYQNFVRRDMVETNIQLVINTLIAYVVITTAIVTAVIGLVRHVSWSRPMRYLSEAARKAARGDFSVRIAPLRKDGKKDFVEVMFDDFNTMIEEIASIETLKSDFIANVSHEIKTPLAVIQSYAAALQSDKLPVNERREYTKTIVEASQKLSSLVSNILKLNKLENQEIIPESRPYSLSEQLRRCVLAFEDFWERKSISIDVYINEEITVSYDEAMLEIVWNNLLSNAIKFTDAGGRISLTLKTTAGDSPPDSTTVLVSDTGCGMDAETQKRIFDKFYQGDTSHTAEGNGLGLALAKKVADLLGGAITVESAVGHGSTFTVRLRKH